MEKKLGRKLNAGEIVHHLNGNKQDNRAGNLELKNGNAEHCYEHRKINSNRRKPAEPNREVSCACGCGKRFEYYDNTGRPRKYIVGHHPVLSPVIDAILCALNNGPAHRGDISRQGGVSLQSIASALTNLKRKDIVCQISGGIWALTPVIKKPQKD